MIFFLYKERHVESSTLQRLSVPSIVWYQNPHTLVLHTRECTFACDINIAHTVNVFARLGILLCDILSRKCVIPWMPCLDWWQSDTQNLSFIVNPVALGSWTIYFWTYPSLNILFIWSRERRNFLRFGKLWYDTQLKKNKKYIILDLMKLCDLVLEHDFITQLFFLCYNTISLSKNIWSYTFDYITQSTISKSLFGAIILNFNSLSTSLSVQSNICATKRPVLRVQCLAL